MNIKEPYAYSLDRETFHGGFATREQAVVAGMTAGQAATSPIEAVFVGRRQPVDPQADLHAEPVIKSMRRRMLERNGNAQWLARVNEHVLADLDAALEHAIVDWLERHDLRPTPVFVAISEHPLPLVREHAPCDSDEVRLLGPEE